METLRYSLVSVEERRPARVSVRGWLAMATGLNLAFAVCVLVCKPPWPHGLSWPGRFRAAAVYMALSCMAGAFGNWIAMPRRSAGELAVLLRGALRGWVFLPAIALFLQRQSFLAQVVASTAAVLMAVYLFPFTSDGAVTVAEEGFFESELFATEVPIGPASWMPFCISVLWAGAVLVAITGKMMIATLLLATAIYLLALQVANLLKRLEEHAERKDRGERTFILITAAFFCVLLGLSNPAVMKTPLFANLGRFAMPSIKTPKVQATPAAGYQTIVLWPVEKEKKTVLRLPAQSASRTPGVAEPLVIPFYGPYWYFKIPGETPGKDARLMKGDSLKVKIHSTDRLPLLMEAHQRLAKPIETDRCAEMQVVVTNDANLGAFQVGLSLADSHAKGKPSLSLGMQHASLQTAGQAEERFVFAFPKRSAVEKFDAITVTFLPDAEHARDGRKVAVERFVVVPR